MLASFIALLIFTISAVLSAMQGNTEIALLCLIAGHMWWREFRESQAAAIMQLLQKRKDNNEEK